MTEAARSAEASLAPEAVAVMKAAAERDDQDETAVSSLRNGLEVVSGCGSDGGSSSRTALERVAAVCLASGRADRGSVRARLWTIAPIGAT